MFNIARNVGEETDRLSDSSMNTKVLIRRPPRLVRATHPPVIPFTYTINAKFDTFNTHPRQTQYPCGLREGRHGFILFYIVTRENCDAAI